MALDYLGNEIGSILVFGFASGFTVGVCILGISSVVHKLVTFYKAG